MDLILAEDVYVYSSLMQWINKTYVIHPCTSTWNSGCGLWINGERNLNGTWYATIDGQKVAMDVSFYNFINNPAYGYSDPGNCMSIKNQNGFGMTPWNCVQPYGPICEYNNVYQPTCKTNNDGKRYFNLAPCKSIATLRDECGNVVKGVCEINTAYTYNDAIQICRNYGMDLFVAETTKIYNAFMQYINGQFGVHPCGSVWSPGCG